MDYSGKIVVVTSELAPSVDAEYRRLHVDGILYKPVHPATLRRLLGELFPDVACATQTVTMAVPDGSAT